MGERRWHVWGWSFPEQQEEHLIRAQTKSFQIPTVSDKQPFYLGWVNKEVQPGLQHSKTIRVSPSFWTFRCAYLWVCKICVCEIVENGEYSIVLLAEGWDTGTSAGMFATLPGQAAILIVFWARLQQGQRPLHILLLQIFNGLPWLLLICTLFNAFVARASLWCLKDSKLLNKWS